MTTSKLLTTFPIIKLPILELSVYPIPSSSTHIWLRVFVKTISLFLNYPQPPYNLPPVPAASPASPAVMTYSTDRLPPQSAHWIVSKHIPQKFILTLTDTFPFLFIIHLKHIVISLRQFTSKQSYS